MKYKEIRAGMEAGQGTQWLHRVVRASRYVLVFMLAAVLVFSFYPSDAAQTALRHKIDALKSERDALKGERDAQVRKLEPVTGRYLQVLHIAPDPLELADLRVALALQGVAFTFEGIDLVTKRGLRGIGGVK